MKTCSLIWLRGWQNNLVLKIKTEKEVMVGEIKCHMKIGPTFSHHWKTNWVFKNKCSRFKFLFTLD